MPTISELEKEYVETHVRSKQLYDEALNCYASGVSHDGRFAKPFPIYATKALGTKKWDVDGNEYLDYVMGHGALLFGYGDSRIITAIQEQIPKAMHIGACTELEIEWAKLIQKLVPCARKGFVRATSCGSEAMQMAIRLSRIYTGKDKVVLHLGSYHGKQGSTIYARRGPPLGIYNVRGIPEGTTRDIVIIPYNLKDVEKAFKTGEVASLVLQGNALYTKDYIEGIKELTDEYGIVFIMDEVVSGFRYSVGGAQEYYDVLPDLTALGKIIGGGAPIGAICGKKEILELYAFKDSYWNRFVRVRVGGTWNAQPISIAGGTAMLKIIDAEREKIYSSINKMGRRLIKSFNEMAEDKRVTAFAYGLPTDHPTEFRIELLNRAVPSNKTHLWEKELETFEDYKIKADFIAGGQANYATYLTMINNGIFSYSGRSGNLCTKYTEEDLKKTENAFDAMLNVLKENKLMERT